MPDGAPLPDDDYVPAVELALASAARARPAAPIVTRLPAWVSRHHPLVVAWHYGEDAGRAGWPTGSPAGLRVPEGPLTCGWVERTPWSSPVTGCRIEVWEEAVDLWRHRLLREDHDEPFTRFTVPSELLHADSRFAVVVFACGPGGFSRPATAPFLFRPASDNPLLAYNPVRPSGLSPDAGECVPFGCDVTLSWHIPLPGRHQVQACVDVYEDGALGSGAALVFSAQLAGGAAAACRCTIPEASWLRRGHTYRCR